MSAPMRQDDFDHITAAFSDFGGHEDTVPPPRSHEAIGIASGTRVATPLGYVAAERLQAGDRVLTADGHHATLIWVGLTRVAARGGNAPVRFETGVMDNIRPLRIGQGHRVRVAGWRAELLFDADAVLATAKSFVNGIDVVIDHNGEDVTYIHLMFEQHEVILAENVACETLRPGPETMRQLDEMARLASDVHLPEMPSASDGGSDRAALPILTVSEEMALRAA